MLGRSGSVCGGGEGFGRETRVESEMKYGIKFQRIDGTWVRLRILDEDREARDRDLRELRRAASSDARPTQYKPFRLLTVEDAEARGEARGAARALRDAADRIEMRSGTLAFERGGSDDDNHLLGEIADEIRESAAEWEGGQ